MLMTLPPAGPLEPVSGGLELYADQIWTELCRRRGSDFPLMNSVEFSLVLSWWEGKIPLRIVLRGLQDTAGRKPSLLYYAPSVARAAEYWRKTVLL